MIEDYLGKTFWYNALISWHAGYVQIDKIDKIKYPDRSHHENHLQTSERGLKPNIKEDMDETSCEKAVLCGVDNCSAGY